MPSLRIRPTSAPTPTRVVAIARPQGCFTACTTIVFVVVGCPVRLPSLHPVLTPQPAAPTHSHSREPTDAHRHRYGRVGLAPGFSSCVSPRRTQWCLPRLGYLGEDTRIMLLSSRFTARVEVTAEQRRRREIKGGPVDFHAPRCHAQDPDTLVTLSVQSTCSERLRR
jgi:hypothetical protein